MDTYIYIYIYIYIEIGKDRKSTKIWDRGGDNVCTKIIKSILHHFCVTPQNTVESLAGLQTCTFDSKQRNIISKTIPIFKQSLFIFE